MSPSDKRSAGNLNYGKWTGSDIGAKEGTATAPVLIAILKAVARGGVKEPIGRGATGKPLMAEPSSRARQQGIGSSKTVIGR